MFPLLHNRFPINAVPNSAFSARQTHPIIILLSCLSAASPNRLLITLVDSSNEDVYDLCSPLLLISLHPDYRISALLNPCNVAELLLSIHYSDTLYSKLY